MLAIPARLQLNLLPVDIRNRQHHLIHVQTASLSHPIGAVRRRAHLVGQVPDHGGIEKQTGVFFLQD